MAISKSTPYVRYKKDFTSSLHLGTIHIESEYLDRTQKTTIESIHGMTWHNKVINENKELNLLSDTQLELTDLEKQYWNTGEKCVSVDEIHTLEEVEPNEDGTYTYTVNSMEGEYIEIYDGINNIISTSDGLDGQFEIVYDTTEEDINGNIALDQVVSQYEITDSGVGTITSAKSTGLTLVNHITEPSKEEVVAIEQQEGQYFTIENTAQGNIKSAILKGSTKYRDINTGDILDTFDETKNLELVSVRMPVLTTRAKNNIDMFNYLESGVTITNKNNNTIIFNSTIEFGGIIYNNIQLKPNTTYTSSFSTNVIQEYIRMYIRYKNTDGTYSNNVGGRVKKLTFTTNNTGIISLNIVSPIIQNGIELSNLQVEDGSIATSYEPYKSNILTVNEEIELREVNGVHDELNLLTGEVTQRVGEIVFDGSENWLGSTVDSAGTFMRFYTIVQDAYLNEQGSDILCDRFTSMSHGNWDKAIEGIHSKQTAIHINIPTSKLESNDASGFKKWLSSNPVTVCYPLATESVKTVDLTVQNQDGNIIPHIQTQQGVTHVSTSSDGLSPVVEMSCSYDTIIKPNTTYTIKLDRPIVSDTMYLQVDLGGTMMMLDADVNAFTIKTPSILSHSQLILSGTGNTVKEIIVLEGNRVNDKIGYFEGMKNVENPILVVSNCPYVFGKGEEVTFKKYQSTTLSLNEPIQLRSIGDVHDEINYETGEYIQRIGECIYEDDSTPTYNSQIGGYFDSMEVKGKIGLAVADGAGAISDKLINQSFTQDDFGIYGNLNGNLNIFDKTVKNEEEFINKYRGTKFQFILLEPIITKIDTTILDQNNNYKSSQQTYDESTYISVQSDTVVTPTSSVDYEIYSSTGIVTGTSATIDNAEVGTPVSGVVYGETLLNVIQEPSETEYIITGDAFEERSGTLENTVEGNIKDIIVKGQTLVNLFEKTSVEMFNPPYLTIKGNVPQLKAGTTYTIRYFNLPANEKINQLRVVERHGSYDDTIHTIPISGSKTFTTRADFSAFESLNIQVIEKESGSISAEELDEVKIVLMEGDHTNVDIPCFEGMQSVNLYPDQTVLKTTGKNLFDITKISDKITISSLNNRQTFIPNVNWIKLWENTYNESGQFTVTIAGYNNGTVNLDWSYRIKFSYTDGTVTSEGGRYIRDGKIVITSESNKIVKNIVIDNPWGVNNYHIYIDSLQIEKNSTATSYEPHKSSILSVNEEVHLHRIGDVQDTLDLITGELTEHIGEAVLDGSEKWTTHVYAGTQIFKTIVIGIRDGMKELMCNRINNSDAINHDTFHFKTTSNGIEIMLDDSSITTIDNFKQYISLSKENPIIIQYKLATPTIKTVGLSIVDQDDKPIDNLHTFDTITHISTYAQGGGLIPFVNIPETISYDTLLKANTQYTIKLNRTNIIDGTPLTVNLGGTELSIEDSADSFTITTPSTLTNNTLSIGGANNKVKEVMVIEGDYVDRDLDFFEGFISVENPIITVANDNYWSRAILPKPVIESFDSDYNAYINTKKPIMKLKPNTQYCANMTITPHIDNIYIIFFEYDEKGNRVDKFGRQVTPTNNGWGTMAATQFTTTNGEIYLRFYPGYSQKDIEDVYKVLKTAEINIFEKQKYNKWETNLGKQGNTLTTYPQVTLRSIGDIKDEWDVVGETVTRRIGKIVLDGSEQIRTTNNGANTNKILFKEKLYYQSIGGDDCNYLMCDKLRCVKYSSFAARLYDFISIGASGVTGYESAIFIKFNSATTVDEWKDLYSQITPITLYCQLETPITESVRITPPNPQTSTASITIPTQLNHVDDTSDFVVWNPYKEHYVRYNYVEDGVVLDNYTWENLTDLDERQFVQFYNKRTYVYQPYHSYVASHDSKGTSKYVLIEPNQDYTVTVRFSELPTCETVKVNLGGAEVEMNVNNPHVHVTTPNTLVNNLCSISGDGLDGKVTDILVIHCLEHEGFADIDYFEGIDGIGEVVDGKASIIVEQTNGNLIDKDFEVYQNGNGIRLVERIDVRPNKKYIFKAIKGMSIEQVDKSLNKISSNVYNNGAELHTDINTAKVMMSASNTYSDGNGSTHTYHPIELCLKGMEKDYIRPRYYDKEEILLPMQLHRINTVYDNFYYDEMKGFYRIQQSIGHKYFVGADSENWTLIERGQRVLRFRYNNADIQIKSLGEYMTNLLPNGTASSPYESCTFNGTTFIVSFDIERFEIISLEQFKLWLSEHPLHLYYQLMTPIMVDLPQYNKRIEFNTYKDEIYTFFKNCKPTVFTLSVPLDQTYRFYELEQGGGYANRVELTDERMTDEDTLYVDTIHGSGFSNLIENPNNVETLLKPNYQGKAVSHTLTNGKVSSIKVHGFEPNETTIANYNSTLKQYELIVQAQKGQNINTQTLAVPYKLEVYEDGTKDRVYYDEQNKLFRFEGGSVTNPPYNNSYIFNTPLEVFKGIAPRTGLIAEIKVKFNSGTTSARIYYSLDGGATTAYSTLRSMTDEVEYYIGFFNTGGTKLDYATKLSAEAEYINLAPLSSTLPESLIITQIQNISECTLTLDKTYYFDSWIKPLELDVYNGETIITEQSGAIVTINNNGLHKDALTYTDETYTVYWTYVGGEGNVTITLGGTKVEVVGTQGYATLKTAIDGVQDGLIIGGYNLSIKDLMLVKGERIEDLAYFEGSRAVGTAFVDENGETKYKITLVTGSELINDKFENRITFEDNNKHNVVVTKLLGNKPNKK